MATLAPIFAIPTASAQLPDSEALNTQLRTLFVQREAEGGKYANAQPYTVRNPDLFESHFDLFSWPEACVQRLAQFCLTELSLTVAQLSGIDSAKMQKMQVSTDAWFHITRRGGFFGIHNHPMASWSGVYCVSPGEHDVGSAQSGHLSFVNPNSLAGMYLDPGNAQIRSPFGFNNFAFDLRAGQLVLFPSWLQHYVLPFYGEGERITVAFNCTFR